ncbi:protein phosphatase 2C domain-containing protein [Fervidobacterium riparium]|uniref:Serine/threonine protein phosphatase PrpC n=1 Tax=Fervidobacterium gondwanense DSM 13020 TaxID=1121883 RepID=A0A1M7TGC4_FERGO|nr:protein phosphatase 2C domain-containing protein [Fervidobacterium gondwanense]UXF00262.1 hypothetical protein IB67_01310 [Fervidobacterium riparium]SHN69766.1 Serine/threonine protein phosphatase PrpC [Fervidobacterium gondwanense DSM 13020]
MAGIGISIPEEVTVLRFEVKSNYRLDLIPNDVENNRVRLPIVIKDGYAYFIKECNQRSLVDLAKDKTISDEVFFELFGKVLELLSNVEKDLFKFYCLAPNSIFLDDDLEPLLYLYYPLFVEGKRAETNLDLPIFISPSNMSLESKNSRLLADLFSRLFLMRFSENEIDFRNRAEYVRNTLLMQGKFDLNHWFNKSYNNKYTFAECSEKYKEAIQLTKKRAEGFDGSNFRGYRLASYSKIGKGKLKPEDDFKETSSVNQDAYFEKKSGEMAIVAVFDGISSSAVGNGNIASRLAAEILKRKYEEFEAKYEENGKVTEKEVKKFFEEFVNEANKNIVAEALNQAEKMEIEITDTSVMMATTFTGVLMVKNEFYMCSVGDSPCYVLNEQSAKKVNIEHNLRLEKLLSGQRFDESDPMLNSLTQALGMATIQNNEIKPVKPSCEFLHSTLMPDEFIMVMSDGVIDFSLGNTENDKEKYFHSLFIDKYNKTNMLKETVEDVLDELNKQAGDNITLCVIKPEFTKIESEEEGDKNEKVS